MAVRTQSKGILRRRSRNNLLGSSLLAVAIVFAALTLNKKSASVEATTPSPIIVAQYDTITLPVPVEPVASGVKIKDIHFKNVAFPKQQVPQGAISSIDEVIDSVTLAALPANLPLFRVNLSQGQHINNPVVVQIPAGMRAMTVRVDVTSSVEGWAGSGSLVDVLLVEKDRTTVVAEMVRILSAERSVSPVEGSAAPNIPSTVTLLVTQEQCLAINTAIPLGKIAFALRSAEDKEKWSNTKYTSDSLRGGSVIKDKKGIITGYLSTQNAMTKKSYALSEGKWIETNIVPEGFFARTDTREEKGENAKN